MDFLNKYFFTAMTFFNCNVLNATPLRYTLMDNQECKIRHVMININNNKPSFYPHGIKIMIN